MSFRLNSSHVFFCFKVLISATLLSSSSVAAAARSPTNETDMQALISIRSLIVSDPHGFLASWNTSVHFCNWQGIICNIRHQRVIALNFSRMELRGTVSPYIGNLTFLRDLKLDSNSFQGAIPLDIGRLYRLQHISLQNNSFQGEIPSNLTHCSDLRIISLSRNLLQGKIPSELSSLSNLQVLNLSQNNLGGSIPSSLGNLSALRSLSFSANRLEGSIPLEFAKLSKLEIFRLSDNMLSGSLPTGIFNISSVQFFDLSLNKFNGSFPWNLGLYLPGIRIFRVGANQFSGPLPASITNASGLQVFDISMNSLSGPVPMNIGNLRVLQRLLLSGNPLGSESIKLNFLTSLTNCTDLTMLHLDYNNHGGVLPSSIANLSTALQSLRLDGNRISGTIPESIGRFINLQELYLSRNSFSGSIPSSIGGISFLSVLEMQENVLEGAIPVSLSDCRKLMKLNLSNNRLTGEIPVEILALSSLSLGLSLAKNQLTGPLPLRVGNLINLENLDVSNNNLSGELPYTLGSCIVLTFLSLQGNRFDGFIPQMFERLKGLEFLDISSNNLSGAIPFSLAELPILEYLNLSFNVLEGEVPDKGIFRNVTAFSIAGNKKLCGGIRSLHLPDCYKERPKREREISFAVMAALLTAGYLIFALLVHVCLFHSCTRERKIQTTEEEDSSPHVGDHYRKISYQDISQATDGFSPTNLIATGRYSSVYKGILKHSEQKVAIKVLNLQNAGARKGFETECEALRNTRHRNLLKIITSCSGTDFKGIEFKALVYEFMPNGSLDNWLHPISDPNSTNLLQQKNLNLIQRLNIAIDVASAIDYLHHCCEIRIIHRDIKPSNILLDYKLNAHLGDFGSARSLLLPIEKSNRLRIRSSAIGIIGTVGYVALGNPSFPFSYFGSKLKFFISIFKILSL